MGMRIEGQLMVHRTDVAGGSSSTGQTSPDHDGMCRRPRNGALPETTSHASDNTRRRRITASRRLIPFLFERTSPGGFDTRTSAKMS